MGRARVLALQLGDEDVAAELQSEAGSRLCPRRFGIRDARAPWEGVLSESLLAWITHGCGPLLAGRRRPASESRSLSGYSLQPGLSFCVAEKTMLSLASAFWKTLPAVLSSWNSKW